MGKEAHGSNSAFWCVCIYIYMHEGQCSTTTKPLLAETARECHGHFKTMVLDQYSQTYFQDLSRKFQVSCQQTTPVTSLYKFDSQKMCHDIQFLCLNWILKSPLQGNCRGASYDSSKLEFACTSFCLPCILKALAESKAQVWTLCCLMLGANVKREIGLRANSTWTFEPVTHRRGKAFEDGFSAMRWMKSLHRQLHKLWGNTKVQKKNCGRKKRAFIPNFPRRRTVIWYMFVCTSYSFCTTGRKNDQDTSEY